jgi:hypothetical protein
LGGFGGIAKADPQWLEAKLAMPYDEILHFVGMISNSCFTIHSNREGVTLDATRGAGGGTGNFIMSFDTYEVSPVQYPTAPKPST